jgi:hypothetical protein
MPSPYIVPCGVGWEVGSSLGALVGSALGAALGALVGSAVGKTMTAGFDRFALQQEESLYESRMSPHVAVSFENIAVALDALVQHA